ncbi:hypothetical protein [uncultured Citrobacter sp.]|jgi:hypothetical protein|uniref:hypothetical protein n=1 Tax=uncultured Citrobacter sp. TaxID=200446 RepID=UPI00280B158F|nr:hypothetical protein [uncultured Citrobacter sp.]MDU5154448.1 hypothetical protein [Citrobacter sp.]
MARPLRKLTREGVVYAQREIVEAEINELEKLSDDDVASRGVVWPKNTPGFISSEALLYFVRNPDTESAPHFVYLICHNPLNRNNSFLLSAFLPRTKLPPAQNAS